MMGRNDGLGGMHHAGWERRRAAAEARWAEGFLPGSFLV
jgi:hypothetical protein